MRGSPFSTRTTRRAGRAEGVERAMAKRNMALVASGSFKRNTTAVKSALLDIMKGQPQAVVMVAPYKPVAEFIKVAHQVKLDAVFVAISFVGSDSLAQELGTRGRRDRQSGRALAVG